jgi:hypothetical protein
MAPVPDEDPANAHTAQDAAQDDGPDRRMADGTDRPMADRTERLPAHESESKPELDHELGPELDHAMEPELEPEAEQEGQRGGSAEGLRLPLSPVSADRVRWVAVVITLVASGALLVASASGYAAALGMTLALALVVAWGWSVLAGSFTPTATSVILGISAVALVLSALRDDLRWVAAGVAFGIVLSFLGQLVRRTGREGLVLTLLASFGGLAVIASGTTAVVATNSTYGTAVAVVAMAAVAAAVVADLLAGVRAAGPLLGLVALIASVVGALVAGAVVDELNTLTALGIGAAAGTVSWSLRRVFALSPAMVTARGQVGAGAGSVLAVGAIVNLFAVFG